MSPVDYCMQENVNSEQFSSYRLLKSFNSDAIIQADKQAHVDLRGPR